MTERYFIKQDAESNKFWEIQFWNNGFRTFWGKIDTIGRFKLEEFESKNACQKEIQKLINDKTKKGYIEKATSSRFLEATVLAEIQEFEEQNEIKAHPLAKKLLNETFIWSCIEETGPFGSDDGNDTFWNYRDWSQENPRGKSIEFMSNLLTEWYGKDFTKLNLEEIEQSRIHEILSKDPIQIPIHIDTTIISTAFSQLVLKGKIDTDTLYLTEIALKRQLMPVCLSHFREDYRETRIIQLKKLLSIIESLK
ncbi:WGR domain-containing protein [Runella aurantiaca]|uniref:WGR domain-containing protein n=1 Tax=Runella aurantiaca TaxID=2282308 RepID=A0A369IC68_9BACT|nr:WGR domain-containing protein [Runella aurantiaca]RDB07359.1 WGR domain-containing protein [Runella aurantiaca]